MLRAPFLSFAMMRLSLGSSSLTQIVGSSAASPLETTGVVSASDGMSVRVGSAP
jgi:hypothetical protein